MKKKSLLIIIILILGVVFAFNILPKKNTNKEMNYINEQADIKKSDLYLKAEREAVESAFFNARVSSKDKPLQLKYEDVDKNLKIQFKELNDTFGTYITYILDEASMTGIYTVRIEDRIYRSNGNGLM